MIRQNTVAEQAEALTLSLFVDVLQAIRMHFTNGTNQWMDVSGRGVARLHTRYVDDAGDVHVITRTVTLTTTHERET